MKKMLIAVAVATVLGGCSSSYDPAEQIRAEYEAKLELERLKAKQAAIESEKKDNLMDSLPDWVTNPPKSDGFGVYGIGIGESSKMVVALDKSMLLAKNSAAEQLDSELNSLVRSYVSERGEAINEDSYSATIEQLVSEVKVVGYTIVEKELVNVENKYYSYTLIHLPYAEFNKAMQQQNVIIESEEIRSAFAELERKVDKKKNRDVAVESTEVEQEVTETSIESTDKI